MPRRTAGNVRGMIRRGTVQDMTLAPAMPRDAAGPAALERRAFDVLRANRAFMPLGISGSRGCPNFCGWPYGSRNSARKPSCSKCRSLVRTSLGPSLRIVCIEMQSVMLLLGRNALGPRLRGKGLDLLVRKVNGQRHGKPSSHRTSWLDTLPTIRRRR